jgi:hypothetical protein
MVLMLLGAFVGLWLWPGPRVVGGVTFDVHTIVYAAAAVLIGFQSVLFAFLSKIFAVSERLLPADENLDRLCRYFTLEVGVVAGALLTLAGLAGSAAMVWVWSTRSFGELEPTVALRAVVPSALAIALGEQVLLSSFFFSLLGLKVRRLEAPAVGGVRRPAPSAEMPAARTQKAA